jgi:hypothetical protein
MPISHTLSPVTLSELCEVSAFVDKVKIIQVTRVPRKTKILLFYSWIQELAWDPSRYQWTNNKPLMDYTTKQCKEFLQKRKPVSNILQLRWNDILPVGFTFQWKAN